ncbi:hypothetical protein KJ866_02530 [Patescibacteria group bacterium]|nr:hypothetical protein [Patescibacteria group bacterium]MBU2264719.1 hypothetical protein [Patescibacteria group bacterium]
MKALLRIDKDERPYKIAVSDWLRDEDGAVIFKVVSKKRRDGKIEMVYYTQRSDSCKRVMQHISFDESEFWKVLGAIKDSLRPFFPEIKFDIQNINIDDRETSRTAKANIFGTAKLLFITWLTCKIHAFKTLFKKNKQA